ncbi:hypothetical protein ISN45_Aa05g011950, partial [Arabidopsis thaliana x Arabidopsis arenosa]
GGGKARNRRTVGEAVDGKHRTRGDQRLGFAFSLSPLALIALSLSLISFHRRGLAVLPANLFGRI